MLKRVTKLFFLSLLLVTAKLYAQPSLTVSDPQMSWYSYKGTIEEATFSVSPKGLYSQVSMYLTFSARGTSFSMGSQLETVFKFDLPEGSFVSDLWLWIGDKISKGALLDTWTASSVYEGIVNRRRDPAILFKKGPRSYELRVYPMDPKGTRKVRVTYLVPNVWSPKVVSVPLPFDLLKLSYNKVPSVNLITWTSDDWRAPRMIDATNPFVAKSDDFFGNYLNMNLGDYDTKTNSTLDFDNPMINGVYFKYFKKADEGFYELSLFPSNSVNVQAKKVLFLIDYDSRKSGTTRKQILDLLKALIKKNYNSGDQFNLFYSGLVTGKASDKWVKTDSLNVEMVFNKVSENSISSYSNLPALLKAGYDFVIKEGGGNVYLISNSDQAGNNLIANSLIADIKNLLTINVPTFILDYNDRDYTYYYFNNRSYIGNEYFYDNLSRTTGGTYQRVSSNFYNSLVDLNQKLSGTVNSFDLYTTLQNGFCYSRQSVGNTIQAVNLNQAITQVGKFMGDFPFMVKTSGIYNSAPFTQTIVIQESGSYVLDNSIEKMWTNNYITQLENSSSQSNSIINEIINLSKGARVLSKYTAFLSVESDTAYCKDCYKDDGKPINTGIEDKGKELPTEFSIGAYPNPFNSQVAITIKLPNNLLGQKLTIRIYNMLGQVIKTFSLDEIQNKNIVQLFWNGMNDYGESVSSGMYIFTVSAPGVSKSIKLMFMK